MRQQSGAIRVRNQGASRSFVQNVSLATPPPRLTPHTCIQILDLVLILECSCDFVALMWYVRKARYPSTNVTHFSSFSFSTTKTRVGEIWGRMGCDRWEKRGVWVRQKKHTHLLHMPLRDGHVDPSGEAMRRREARSVGDRSQLMGGLLRSTETKSRE